MPHPALRWLPLLVLPALVPSGIRAQDIPSPYRFVERGQAAGIFVGILSPDRGRFGFGPGPGLLYGARYAVEVGGPVALEGSVAHFDTERDVVNPARVEGDRVIDQADASYLVLDARLRLNLTGRRTWNGFTPYLFAGGGLTLDLLGVEPEDEPLAEEDRIEKGNRFLASFGGGFRYFLRERLALRTDLSLSLYQLDVPEGYRDPLRDFEAVPESEWVSASGVTLGLSYLF